MNNTKLKRVVWYFCFWLIWPIWLLWLSIPYYSHEIGITEADNLITYTKIIKLVATLSATSLLIGW